jgi:hypothetical protein
MSDPSVPQNTLVISDSGMASGRVLRTPEGRRDLALLVITPLMAILVRALKTFLQTWIALMGASLTTDLIPARDFFHRAAICASLAVAASVMSVATNVSGLLTALGEKFPLLKA